MLAITPATSAIINKIMNFNKKNCYINYFRFTIKRLTKTKIGFDSRIEPIRPTIEVKITNMPAIIILYVEIMYILGDTSVRYSSFWMIAKVPKDIRPIPHSLNITKNEIAKY